MRKVEFAAGMVGGVRRAAEGPPNPKQALWDREWTAASSLGTLGVSISSQTTDRSARRRNGSPGIVQKKWPRKSGPYAISDLARAIGAALTRMSDVGARDVAVANCHFGIGQQQAVDRRKQAAERGAGRRERDGSSSGHRVPFSWQAATCRLLIFREIMYARCQGQQICLHGSIFDTASQYRTI